MAPSTFSIAACDLERAEWGVAVQSKFLAVGALCAWAEPEVGAVATQAWVNPSFGPDGLRLLREGLTARETVDRLIAEDNGRDRRQLGVVDGAGGAHAYTGAQCPEWAGSRTGPGYAAQGNILVSEATVNAMAASFQTLAGRPLAERLLESLKAGQAAGGDRRGQQAARLYVVKGGAGYGGGDILVDLRVDDHREPIQELERLLELHRLYFGQTPDREWLTVDDELRAELRDRLGALGYASGDLASDLETWAGIENLEERVRGVDRVDPVVLTQLRRDPSPAAG